MLPVLPDSIFKAYDIRGIYPQEMNEENIVTIIKAIYSFFVTDLKRDKLTVVLGRDMRVSSPSLFAKAKETLVSLGAAVIDVGLVSTPTFYFAVLHYGYDCGIQISASHNPKEYNGIKFVKRVGNTLIKIGKSTGMEDVKARALSSTFIEGKEPGKASNQEGVVANEVEFALKTVNPKNLKPLKVVADPANAMGALFLEELFKKVPGNLIKMNFELDGTFPAHQPDPLQFDTLKDLQARVLAEKADLGIAPDGDGDRVFFVDEKGKVIPATMITSLITKEILEKNPGEMIIADIRDVMNVKNVCVKYGGKFSISKVGHALITEQLHAESAVFAGESSGHFFFKETGGGENSVFTILYVLNAIGKENKPISEILSQFHTWEESGEINFQRDQTVNSKDLLEKLALAYPDGQVSWLDGLSVDFPDWRFNLRASNTEPLLRLNLEAKSKNLLQQHLPQVLKKLEVAGTIRK